MSMINNDLINEDGSSCPYRSGLLVFLADLYVVVAAVSCIVFRVRCVIVIFVVGIGVHVLFLYSLKVSYVASYAMPCFATSCYSVVVSRDDNVRRVVEVGCEFITLWLLYQNVVTDLYWAFFYLTLLIRILFVILLPLSFFLASIFVTFTRFRRCRTGSFPWIVRLNNSSAGAILVAQ